MSNLVKIISNILDKASNPFLDVETAQWIVAQEECTHIWRAQRIGDELNEVQPNYVSNKVGSAMSNLTLILKKHAEKYNLPILYESKSQIIESTGTDVYDLKSDPTTKSDAKKRIKIHYSESIGNPAFLANILTFCFYMIKGFRGDIDVLDRARDLGAAVIPYLFVIDPEVSMPATRCLGQICGLVGYKPSLAIIDVLIAKATLVWFGNGSSKAASAIGIRQYLFGQGRHLIDNVQHKLANLKISDYISGPQANELVSQLALVKSYEVPSWRKLLVAQQAYAQATLMILLQPEAFNSVMLFAPFSLRALVDLCRKPFENDLELARIAVIESLTMMMRFCYSLNSIQLMHELNLTALLGELQYENVDPTYFHQLCDLANFLPSSSTLDLLPLLLDIVERKSIDFYSRFSILETLVRKVSHMPLTLSQLNDLIVRSQKELIEFINLHANEESSLHLNDLGTLQRFSFSELLHLYVELLLVASNAAAITSVLWEQQILESRVVQVIIYALSQYHFIELVSPSCIRDLYKILSTLKMNHQARIRYIDNSGFENFLESGEYALVKHISHSTLYWEALWYSYDIRWPSNIDATVSIPNIRIELKDLNFRVNVFRELLDRCFSSQKADYDAKNLESPGQPIRPFFDLEILLKFIIWGQVANQEFEEFANDVFLSIVELESNYCETFESEYLLRWLSSIKLKPIFLGKLNQICKLSSSKSLKILSDNFQCPDYYALEPTIQEEISPLMTDEKRSVFTNTLKIFKDVKRFDKDVHTDDLEFLKLWIPQGLSSSNLAEKMFFGKIIKRLPIPLSFHIASFIISNCYNSSRSQRFQLVQPFIQLWNSQSNESDFHSDDLFTLVENVLSCMKFDLHSAGPYIDSTMWMVLDHFYSRAPKDSQAFTLLSGLSSRLKEVIFDELGFEIDEKYFNCQFGWKESFSEFLESQIASEDALAHPMRKFPESTMAAFSRAATQNVKVKFSKRFFDIVTNRIITASENSRYQWMDLLKIYCYFSDVSNSNLEEMKRGVADYCKMIYSKVSNEEWIHPTTFICWRDLWVTEIRAANDKMLDEYICNDKFERESLKIEPLETPLSFLNVTRAAIDALPVIKNSNGGFRSLLWFNFMLGYRDPNYAVKFAESGLLLNLINRLCCLEHLTFLEPYLVFLDFSYDYVLSQRLTAQCLHEEINKDAAFEAVHIGSWFDLNDYESVPLVLEAIKQSCAFYKGTLFPRRTLENASIASGSDSNSCLPFDSRQFSDIPEASLAHMVDSLSTCFLRSTDFNKKNSQPDAFKALCSLRVLLEIIRTSSSARLHINLDVILRCFSIGNLANYDDPRMETESATPKLSTVANRFLTDLTRESDYDIVTSKVWENLETQIEKLLLGVKITLGETIPKLASHNLEEAVFCFEHCIEVFKTSIIGNIGDDHVLWSLANSHDGFYKPFTLIKHHRIMELIARCSLIFEGNALYMHIVGDDVVSAFTRFNEIQNLKLIDCIPSLNKCIETGSFTDLIYTWSDTDCSTLTAYSDENISLLDTNNTEGQGIGEGPFDDCERHLKKTIQIHCNINNWLANIENNAFRENESTAAFDDSRRETRSTPPKVEQNVSEHSLKERSTSDFRTSELNLRQYQFLLEVGPQTYFEKDTLSQYLAEIESNAKNNDLIDVYKKIKRHDFDEEDGEDSDINSPIPTFECTDQALPPDFSYISSVLLFSSCYVGITALCRNPDSLVDCSDNDNRRDFGERLELAAEKYAQTTSLNFDDTERLAQMPRDVDYLQISETAIVPYKIDRDLYEEKYSNKMGLFLCLSAFSYLSDCKAVGCYSHFKMFFNYYNVEQIFTIIMDLLVDPSTEHTAFVYNSVRNRVIGTTLLSSLGHGFADLTMRDSVALSLFTTAPPVISKLMNFLISAIVESHQQKVEDEEAVVVGEFLSKYGNELVSFLCTPIVSQSKLLLEKACEFLDKLIRINPSKFEPHLTAQSISRLIHLLSSKECEYSNFAVITKIVYKFIRDPEISVAIVKEFQNSAKLLIALLQFSSGPFDLETQIKHTGEIATERFKVLRLLYLIGKLFTGHKYFDVLGKIDILSLWQSSLNQIGDMQKHPITDILSALSVLDLFAIPAVSVKREFPICQQKTLGSLEFLKYRHLYQQLTNFIRCKLSKFKPLIRELLSHKPNLVSDQLEELAHIYDFLTFEQKKLSLDSALKKSKAKRRNYSPSCLAIDRTQLLESSIEKILSLRSYEMKRGIRLYFTDEPNKFDKSTRYDKYENIPLDLLLEWVELLEKEIFSETYGFFTYNTVLLTISQVDAGSKAESDKRIKFFNFVGRFLGRLVFDRRTIDLRLSRSIYAYLTRSQVCLEDMELIDETLYKILLNVLTTEIPDTFDQTFSLECDYFGDSRVVDLVPGGRKIRVTEQTKSEFVKLAVEFRLIKCFEKQLKAIASGFYDVVKLELIRSLSALELELVITGMPNIDVEEWTHNITYEGYSLTSEHIEWFWEAVRSFDQEQCVKLLNSWTGSCRFQFDCSNDEHQKGLHYTKLIITKENGSTDRLPCFNKGMNQLLLPPFESYMKLRFLLLKAITEDTMG